MRRTGKTSAFRFHAGYFLAMAGLLTLEIVIALAVHDGFVRPYAGDFLAVIWLYCLARSLVAVSPGRAVTSALLFAYMLEILQYVHLLSWLGWQHSRVARIVLGSSFSWGDMLAYTLGAVVVAGFERVVSSPSKPWKKKQGTELSSREFW